MEKENIDKILKSKIKLTEEEIESLYQQGKKDYKRIIRSLDPRRLISQAFSPKKTVKSDELE